MKSNKNYYLNNKECIYILSVINSRKGDKSIIGIVKNIDDLIFMVINNHSDIFEYYYDYAVIEKVFLHPAVYMKQSEQVKWFYASYDKDGVFVEECKQPDFAIDIFNYFD